MINQRQSPPSSAFERHQIALEKERESVQVNFVSCAIGTRSALTYHRDSGNRSFRSKVVSIEVRFDRNQTSVRSKARVSSIEELI